MKKALLPLVLLVLASLAALWGWRVGNLARPEPSSGPDVLATRFFQSAPLPARTTPTPPTTPTRLPVGIQLSWDDPLTLPGDILVGSTESLQPLTDLVYTEFVAQGYPGRVIREELWGNDALSLLCTTDRYDIVSAARALRPEELDTCRRQGREPVVLPVAQGALVMVTHPENPLTLTLTTRQLQELWLAYQWSDLRAEWPDTSIRRYTPAPESDVYTYYASQFLGKPLDDIHNAAAKAPPNTTASFDFSDLVQKIMADPNALAILDYHIYLAARGSFKQIQVDGSTNGDDARLSENYPLQFPLFLYTTRSTLQNKAQVRAFLAFYIMHAERFVNAAQQLPLNPAQLENSKIQFLAALENPSLLREFGVVLTTPPPTEGTPLSTAVPTTDPGGEN